MEGFTAALMQFRFRMFPTVPFSLATYALLNESTTARNKDIFVYLFLCIQIYSWISQIKQFPLYTHLRSRDRWARLQTRCCWQEETRKKTRSLVQMFDLFLWTYGGFLFRFVLLSSLWEHNASGNAKHIDQLAMMAGTKVDIWTDVMKSDGGNEVL